MGMYLPNFESVFNQIVFGNEYAATMVNSSEKPTQSETGKKVVEMISNDIFANPSNNVMTIITNIFENSSMNQDDIRRYNNFYQLMKTNISKILCDKMGDIIPLSDELLHGELPMEFMRLERLVNTIMRAFNENSIDDKTSFMLTNLKLSHVLNHRGPLEVKELGTKSNRGSLSSRFERLSNRIKNKEATDFNYIVKWFGDIDLYKFILFLGTKRYVPELKTVGEFTSFIVDDDSAKVIAEIEKQVKAEQPMERTESEGKISNLESLIENFINDPSEKKSIVKLLSQIKLVDMLSFINRFSVREYETMEPEQLANHVAASLLKLKMMKNQNKKITVKYLVKMFGDYNLTAILAIICNIFVLEM